MSKQATYKSVQTRQRQELHKLLLRAMTSAGWQAAYAPAVEYVKRHFLMDKYGVHSSEQLDDDTLNLAVIALRTKRITLQRPPYKELAAATGSQVRQIIALDYSIKKFTGKRILDEWLPKLTAKYYDNTGLLYIDAFRLDARAVKKPGDLTRVEADYCIKRLLKIEEKLHLGGFRRDGLLSERDADRLKRALKDLL